MIEIARRRELALLKRLVLPPTGVLTAQVRDAERPFRSLLYEVLDQVAVEMHARGSHPADELG